jgi:hypothetical protein
MEAKMSKRKLGVLLFLGIMMTSFPAGAVLRVNSYAASGIGNQQADAEGQLKLTSLHLFFEGQPADELITGMKAKRYTIDLTGAAFDPASRVVIGEQKVPTTFLSATELTARLRGGLTPAPTELSVKVINPDGQISNALSVDVISNPADLSLLSLSPDFGTGGEQIKLTGVGFTKTGNRLRIRSTAQPSLTGLSMDFPSADGRILTPDMPSILCPPCTLLTPPCLVQCFQIAPGDYQVSIVNANGISNSLRFLVSSAHGPIGVWGGDHIRVEVSDSQVRVTGLCFEGSIEQTVELDAAGRFDLAGQVSFFIGPAARGHPARYSGSIAGDVMTLVITPTDSNSPLGPFTLVFGKDVQVVHPCV